MKGQILLVDDDSNFLMGLQRALRNEDFQILCATSADEALFILSEKLIDLVVSDHAMPGTTGTELLATVCRKFPDTVRFILTGKATLDVAVEAINKGEISRFFVKPCNTTDLAVSIRQSLEQKELMSQAKRLLRKVQQQSDTLSLIESKHPGITDVKRDEEGVILIEDIHVDLNTLINEIDRALEPEKAKDETAP